MRVITKIVWLLVSLISVSELSGCTTPGKNMLPHGHMSMTEIYRAQTGLSGPEDTFSMGRVQLSRASSHSRHKRYATQIREASLDNASEKSQEETFKVLPNPNMTVYIFAHLSHFNETNVPVPGYKTHFFLYERNHYAMPSERY